MLRRLFAAAAAVSLLVCLATVGLWLRSRSVSDRVERSVAYGPDGREVPGGWPPGRSARPLPGSFMLTARVRLCNGWVMWEHWPYTAALDGAYLAGSVPNWRSLPSVAVPGERPIRADHQVAGVGIERTDRSYAGVRERVWYGYVPLAYPAAAAGLLPTLWFAGRLRSRRRPGGFPVEVGPPGPASRAEPGMAPPAGIISR